MPSVGARMDVTTADYLHRWMIKRDLPEVLDICRRQFARPWSEAEFLKLLRKRDCIGRVTQYHRGDYRRIVGYLVYSLVRKKRLIEIVTMAVHPEETRQGIGSQLLMVPMNRVNAGQYDWIVATVPSRNVAAHLFFRSVGFRCMAEYSPINGEEGALIFAFGEKAGAALFEC